MAGRSRSFAVALPLGASFPGETQDVPLPGLVPRHSGSLRPGNVARFADTVASVSGAERRGGRCPRASQGQSQLYNRDSPASLAGVDSPAFLGRKMTFRT